MLSAPVLVSTIAGATVDGKVQVQITWQPYAGAAGYYSPVLVANVANGAGLNIAGGPVAWEEDAATVTTAIVQVPVGAGVVSVTLSGFAYSLPETDPNFNSSLVWIAQSNAITVDVGGTKHGHKK